MVKYLMSLRNTLNEEIGFVDDELHQEMDEITQPAMVAMQTAIQQYDNRIKNLLEQDIELSNKAKIVQSIPGFGQVIASKLIQVTYGFTRLTDPRQLACFAGVAPFEYSSGTSLKGKTRISHLANKEIKNLSRSFGRGMLHLAANPPAVILTTAYRDYALESYEITVVDYLLKPISFSRFFKAVTKYLSTSNKVTNPQATPTSNSQSGSIYVYANKKNIKVYFDEILYLESIKDYVRIYTTGKNIITKDTISKYEMLLPNSFMRIHRSFIVNSAKITACLLYTSDAADE